MDTFQIDGGDELIMPTLNYGLSQLDWGIWLILFCLEKTIKITDRNLKAVPLL